MHSEYLNDEYLSSNAIEMAHPCDRCFLGQQVVVNWGLPKCEPAYLILTLRYGSREIQEVKVDIFKRKGYFIFRLLNDDYFQRGGIVSYKVDLFQNDTLVDSWKHHVWAEIFSI